MKLLIISAVLGVATAAFGPSAYPEQSNRPQAAYEKNARILSHEADLKDDSFRYSFETENGIKAQNEGRDVDGIQSQGGYQYTGDDGQVYSVSFVAGPDGFQAQGAHLPTAPPTPEAILQALELNAQHEAAGIFDDGQYNPDKYGDAPAAPAARAFGQQNNRVSSGFRQTFKY